VNKESSPGVGTPASAGGLCVPYYSCYAGTTPNLATGLSGVAQAVVGATSKLPCFPTTTGECDVTAAPPLGNSENPATSTPSNLGGYESAATNTAKKYQYWSVKVKPYLETQVSI
jgi:hypothetical protein